MSEADLIGSRITDWGSFHDECASVFGFPEFYGRNFNAWIDCLTYVREGDGMSRYQLGPDEALVIHVRDAESFRLHAPEQFAALIDGATFVNRRQIDAGEKPALHLVFQ